MTWVFHRKVIRSQCETVYCDTTFRSLLHYLLFLLPLLVHRPVYSARLWLLWQHQGDWSQESHRSDQTARHHRGDSGKHRPKRTSIVATVWKIKKVEQQEARVLNLLCVSSMPPCRSTLLQRTGCTKRPGVCFSSQKWLIAPRWSWSGASRTRMGWSSSCVTRNSSGEPTADSPQHRAARGSRLLCKRLALMMVLMFVDVVILWPASYKTSDH